MTEQHRPVELRRAVIQAVDTDGRTVELIACPYDEWTDQVEYQGRMIAEAFAPGAFGAVDTRNARKPMKVVLEHDPSQWVGRVERLHPNDPRGLRAELLLRRQCRDVLDDCADGMYCASVGFAPITERWEGRSRRLVVSAYLDHIALTAEPAYAGAEILQVRSAARSSTPNLDRILAERAEAGYAPGVER